MATADKTTTEVGAIVAHAKTPCVEIIEGAPHLLYPPGWNSEDLSRFLPVPLRIKESPEFTGASDLAAYYKEFAAVGTRIFVDDIKWRFTTIFDCSTPGSPRHGDHSASLQMKLAPEWEKWKAQNAKSMAGRDFVTFLENNIDNLGDDDFPAAQLLDMCRRIRIAIKGDVTVDEIDSDGVRSLVAASNVRVAGQTAGGETVPYPEFMTVNLRIFRNAARYKFKARLRWDCTDGKVTFRFDLQNIDTVEEAAFDEVIADVAARTEAPVLRGAYAGAYHKK